MLKKINTIYLPVHGNNVFNIYIEEYGNLKGIPLLILHGGPGGASDTPKELKLFTNTNRKKYRIVYFHQRGCGKTKCPLKYNKTEYIIQDIEKIRKHLGIKKWGCVYGGSWGATLGVCYGIKHPTKIKNLVVFGLSLFDVYVEDSSKILTPGAYNKWKIKGTDKRTMDFYFTKLKARSGRTRDKYTKLWCDFENFCINPPSGAKGRLRRPKKVSTGQRDLALLECYYYKNKGFLPKNYILKNAKKLQKIHKVVLIHGRFDAVCSFTNSYRLCETIRSSSMKQRCKLITTNGGHSLGTPENKKAIIHNLK